MVSRDYMCRAALRQDTAPSRAMLRALGVPVPEPRPRPGRVVRLDRYEGVEWCFANHGSPMDGLR
ncbi:hypothetical protein [uncultured Parolsenella sp.]|uniref:hypothetical protein n=1 Tax=uncultured Parolsenella sp. TaxID=2083008 RepID=UPI0027D9ACE5|nr:hypothetical protein [uncultured Parolsenella sp.]